MGILILFFTVPCISGFLAAVAMPHQSLAEVTALVAVPGAVLVHRA